jgi:methyl-accepting chemotaxis protein
MEGEAEETKGEINSILEILKMLSDNISISVGEIKAKLQAASTDAIDASADKFNEIIDYLEGIVSAAQEIKEEIANSGDETIDNFISTLQLNKEYAADSVEQIMSEIREKASVAVQESSEEFDNLISDLMEILENVHLTLRKLANTVQRWPPLLPARRSWTRTWRHATKAWKTSRPSRTQLTRRSSSGLQN